MNQSQLADLARQGFTRVPVVRRLLADLETPLSAYLKFAGPCSFLLESVEGGEKWGRYSMIGLPCAKRLVVRGDRVEVYEGAVLLESSEVDDPLAFVQDYAQRERVFPHAALPMFSGGLVGYFGYDCARMVERHLAAGTPPKRTPPTPRSHGKKGTPPHVGQTPRRRNDRSRTTKQAIIAQPGEIPP